MSEKLTPFQEAVRVIKYYAEKDSVIDGVDKSLATDFLDKFDHLVNRIAIRDGWDWKRNAGQKS